MVIPWLGFSLSELLNKVEIKSSAKFVEFETVYNPEEMVGQRYPVLNWPYICLLYTSPSPRDMRRSRMPSSA